MIAKYLFFLILFMVILIHALQPWTRLGAAALFVSGGGQSHGTWFGVFGRSYGTSVSIHPGECIASQGKWRPLEQRKLYSLRSSSHSTADLLDLDYRSA